jgi:hypothetical protein
LSTDIATVGDGVTFTQSQPDPEILQFSQTDEALTAKMTTLVKGVGFSNTAKPTAFGQPGNAELVEPAEVFPLAMRAETEFRAAIKKGWKDPIGVVNSWNPGFTAQYPGYAALFKSYTTTTPLATGLAPFNLVAPSRLIYPVFAPIRAKLPRTQGQGLSYRAKVVTGISGTQTGSSGGRIVDIAIPELVQGSGNMNNWPLNLPPSGVQDAVDLNIAYKFNGLSEAVSWLAQFSGQGFEDISALANLQLLQEFMLGEEYQLIAGTATALTTPTAATATVRAANAGETALSGTITNNTLDIKVTAANWYGETAPSSVTAATSVTSGTSVVDVAFVPVAGALWYNVYVTVGTSPGTYHLMAGQSGGTNGSQTGPVGGLNFTLQGAVPTTGVLIPTSDTGTYSSLRPEGIQSVLSGHTSNANGYPSGWQGGYINQSIGDTLKISVLNTALQGLFDGSGAYRADPAELIGEYGDITRLSNDIVQAGSATNYRLFVTQADASGVRAGAAVSEFVNPGTRSIIRIVVHPWWVQGTVWLMTYQLPFTWSNVANAWEVNLVQDYLSISWPVIDATFRYSLFNYGTPVANAPFYSGLLQGIQKTDRSGSTGTWS